MIDASPIPLYLIRRPAPLTCGTPVEIHGGPHAGCRGKVAEITIATTRREEWVLVAVDDGTWVQAARADVRAIETA